MHLPGCVHLDQSHIGRTGQADRTADQCDARAMRCTGGRKCMALLSGRSVGNIAHWVNWLMCWARCDQHMPPGKTVSFAMQKLSCCIGNINWFSKTTNPYLAAGRIAADGRNNLHTALFQTGQIILCCGMLPHIWVHGRCHHDRRIGCQTQC